MNALLRKRDSNDEIDEQASEKHQKMSFDVSLNYDVLIHIFGFLDQQALCAAAMVCKDWKMAAYCPLLWKNTLFTLNNDALNDESARSLVKRGIKIVKAKVTDEDTESFGQALVTCAEVVRCEALYLYDHRTADESPCIFALFPHNFSSLKHLALITPMLKLEDDEEFEKLLSPLVNIEKLYIRWADDHFDDRVEYLDLMRAIFTSLPKLKDLELVNDAFLVVYDHNLDDSLEIVCPQLERLVVDIDESIDGSAGLMSLPVYFPGVKHLVLPASNISDWPWEVDLDNKGSFQSLESLNLGPEACATLLPEDFTTIFRSSLNLKAVDLTVSTPPYGFDELQDEDFKAIIEALPNLSVLIYGHFVSLECINGLMPKMKDLVMLASVGTDPVNDNAVEEFLTNIQTHMHKLTSLLDIGVDLAEYLDRLSNVRYICHQDCSDWRNGIWKRLDANPHTDQQCNSANSMTEWVEVRKGSADWHEAVCTSWFTLPGSFDFGLIAYPTDLTA